MHIPITKAELEALVSKARHQTIPLTATTDTRVDSGFAIDSDAIGADWSLAQLAVLRLPTPLRVGGPIQHTGARELGGGNPQDHLAGYERCEGCGGTEFMCADTSQHDTDGDGENTADGYSFANYGERLDHRKIQDLIMASGLVTEYGAAQLAAWLDMQAYVLREPNEEI